jgi:tripartite-type tricarboxylate transporter receptor subunit TctC
VDRCQAIFSPVPESIEHIKAGRLRALAATTKVPQEVLPSVPTLSSFLPEYEASGWQMPVEIIDRLNREVNRALGDPKIRARLTELGGSPLQFAPAEFGRFIVDETDKWGRVICAAHIRVE